MNNNVKDCIEIIYWIVSLPILIATVIAIYIGPIRAIEIGRKLDSDWDKRESKRDLFLTLFSYRGEPVHIEFVNSLNKIEIVFQDEKTVLDAWHKYYEALHVKDSVNQLEIWNLHRVELLSAMANCLGYNSVSQTEIIKYYSPEGHDNWRKEQTEFRNVQHSFYHSGAHLHKMMISERENTNSEE